MLAFAGKAILSFSSTPLMLAVWLGALGFVCCLGVSAWAFIRHAQGHTVSGWTSLFLGFMYGQSMTFMLLGIIGTYLSRMFTEAQDRPRYIIKKSKAVRKESLKRVA